MLHQGAVGATARRSDWPNGILADWDLFTLLVLILADVRIFRGSAVASFTLLELFAWGYCLPFIIGHALSRRPIPCLIFVYPLSLYLGWILLAALFALLFRHHSEVLQQAKNVLVALPLVSFVLIRLRRPETVARLANLYVLYCILACVFALVQLKQGGPYLRPLNENDEYKLDFSGNLVSNVIVGLSDTPNGLGLAVLPGVMCSAIKLVYEVREGRFPRLITMVCLALTGTALLLAQSRGALLWSIFGFACIVCLPRHNRSSLLKFGLVASLIAMLVGYDRYFASQSDGTVEVRFLLWKTSFDAIAYDPYVAVLGDGMKFVEDRSWQIAGWEFPDAHNGWIDQILFFGFPAFVLYFRLWQRFFLITDQPAPSVLLDGIRGSIIALMGLYFFEPVAHAVFAVSQLFLLMSCGVGLAGLLGRGRLGQVEIQEHADDQTAGAFGVATDISGRLLRRHNHSANGDDCQRY